MAKNKRKMGVDSKYLSNIISKSNNSRQGNYEITIVSNKCDKLSSSNQIAFPHSCGEDDYFQAVLTQMEAESFRIGG